MHSFPFCKGLGARGLKKEAFLFLNSNLHTLYKRDKILLRFLVVATGQTVLFWSLVKSMMTESSMPAFGYDLYMIAFDLCVSYIIQSVQAETLKKQVEPQLYQKNHFLELIFSFLLSLKAGFFFTDFAVSRTTEFPKP